MDKISLLLADDHTVVREGTRELLEREPDMKVVGEAGDGEQAVRLVSELQPDVVIMDIAMPKLSGIEATRQIKTLCPSTAVLVLTAYDNDQYVFALLEAGAAGYLLKDVRSQELINAIRAVNAGESVLHPAITRKVINRFAFRAKEPKPEEKKLDQLTEREMEVLKLAAKGMTNKDIAHHLTLSTRTVHTHLSNIFSKMQVGSRTEAILFALKEGRLSLEDCL